MDSSTNWPDRVADRLGPLEEARPAGGRGWRARVAGRPVLVKTGPGVADEGAGLAALASVAGGPMIPDVLLAEDDLLVIAWVEAVAPASAHQEDLGRSLAALHNRSWSDWGGGSSWIGECPVDPRPALTGPEFYRRRLTDLAARCGLSQPVAAVTNRLSELVPPADPALLHGDLWWGNVVWAPSGRVCLIDPSVHGGHPEEDLAMLALFGPIPPVVYAAYEEVSPLDDGWEGRVAFWQLYPLLVHTVLFGGSYRGQVETAARRFA